MPRVSLKYLFFSWSPISVIIFDRFTIYKNILWPRYVSTGFENNGISQKTPTLSGSWFENNRKGLFLQFFYCNRTGPKLSFGHFDKLSE